MTKISQKNIEKWQKRGKREKSTKKKDKPATKKVDKEEKEATYKKNDKRVSKLRRKLKFSKRLSAYKLKKTAKTAYYGQRIPQQPVTVFSCNRTTEKNLISGDRQY